MDKDKIKKIIHYDGSFLQKIHQWYIMKTPERTRNKWISQRNKKLQTYGLEILNILSSVSKEESKMLWIDYGTLLGAYREHSFISHDYDIDCGMYASDYSMDFENELLDKGLKKQRVLYTKDINSGKNILTEVTFVYKGLLIDIFLYFVQDNKMFGYGYRQTVNKKEFKVLKSYLPKVIKLSELPIDGNLYPSPQNADEILKTVYGSKFMTPIKDFVMPDSDSHYEHLDFSAFRGYMKGNMI